MPQYLSTMTRLVVGPGAFERGNDWHMSLDIRQEKGGVAFVVEFSI